MKTNPTKESRCPACNKDFDAASSVDHDKKPKQGDYSICICCGEFLMFNEDLSLHRLSFQEKLTLKFEHPELYKMLMIIKGEIVAMHNLN